MSETNDDFKCATCKQVVKGFRDGRCPSCGGVLYNVTAACTLHGDNCSGYGCDGKTKPE